MNQQEWEHRVYEEVRKLTIARGREGVGHEIDTLQVLYNQARQFEKSQAEVERLRADHEAMEILRRRKFSISWDPEPRWLGWEVQLPADDDHPGGFMVHCIADPAEAIKAAEATGEQK